MSQYHRNFTPQFDLGESDSKCQEKNKDEVAKEGLASKRNLIPAVDFLSSEPLPRTAPVSHLGYYHDRVTGSEAQNALEQRGSVKEKGQNDNPKSPRVNHQNPNP